MATIAVSPKDPFMETLTQLAASLERLATRTERVAENFASHDGECRQWRLRVEDLIRALKDTIVTIQDSIDDVNKRIDEQNKHLSDTDGLASSNWAKTYRAVIFFLIGFIGTIGGGVLSHVVFK